jgi:HAD superfamily hydrolase (TIGR01450 family)
VHNIKAIAFDLDGTIYYGNQVIDGAAGTIEYLKSKGIKVFYFTNNSTKTREQIYSKLKGMGLDLSLDTVYTSAYATAVYCKESQLDSVYCIGSNGLISELNGHGISTNNEKVKAVVVGLDLNINYDKIATALLHIQNGCKLIVCNQDKNYPVEGGRLLPGCGSMVAAVLGSCNRTMDFEVGKPNTYMIELLTNNYGFTNKDILVVGDSLDSDIEMANRYGCKSILVTKDNSIKQLRNCY